MNSDHDLKITKGRLLIYRLFDVADEIDLTVVERKTKEATRVRPSKIPFSKALHFKNPPLSLELKPFSITLASSKFNVSVIAKVFDFGVVSICFVIPAEGLTLKDLTEVAIAADRDKGLHQRAVQYIRALMDTFSEALSVASLKENFFEDYFITYIQEFNHTPSMQDLIDSFPLANLLLMDPRTSLSHRTIQEALRHRFSYYQDDLVVLHYDSAVVVDPSGSTDIADILEFANAQILELRFYDSLLDRELQWLYDELEKQREPSIFNLRAYRGILKRLSRVVTELTEVTERVHNALKVTEDVYYSRIYRTAMALLRSADWEESINEKLRIVTNTYRMLSDELSTRREQLIELGIFLLIVLEILLALLS